MHTSSLRHIVCDAKTYLTTKQIISGILQGTHRVIYDDRDDEQERLLLVRTCWHFIDSPVPPRLQAKVQAGCRTSRCHPM